MLDLLRRDTLVFACEELRHRGWLFEHVNFATVEQRIFDEAGNEVGRVRELPPLTKPTPTLDNGAHYGKIVRAAVYDSNDSKIVEFSGSRGLRRLLGREVEWGQRLEVADGAGRPVGALVTPEFRSGGMLESSSGERIGAARETKGVVRTCFDYTIEDSTGTEVGWIADDRGHARRLGRSGAARREGTPEAAARRPHHFLAITGQITPDLRLMTIAVSAGLHLVLSPWSGPSE